MHINSLQYVTMDSMKLVTDLRCGTGLKSYNNTLGRHVWQRLSVFNEVCFYWLECWWCQWFGGAVYVERYQLLIFWLYYVTVCHWSMFAFQRGNHPPISQLVDQLGHQDVLCTDRHTSQITYDNAEWGTWTDRIHILW